MDLNLKYISGPDVKSDPDKTLVIEEDEDPNDGFVVD
jgi:hypothetical protein